MTLCMGSCLHSGFFPGGGVVWQLPYPLCPRAMETVATLGDSLGSALFFIFSSIINAQALCFSHPDSYLHPLKREAMM